MGDYYSVRCGYRLSNRAGILAKSPVGSAFGQIRRYNDMPACRKNAANPFPKLLF